MRAEATSTNTEFLRSFGTGSAEPAGGQDRREADRFPIVREVRYRLSGSRGFSQEGFGQTINISSNGVLFTADKQLPKGARIELSISWPAQLDGRCSLKLVARGRIARTDEGCQVAVEIQQYEFRTAGRAA